MFHLIPPPLHRVVLRVVHALRHRWRQWRKTELAGVSAILRDNEERVLLVRHSYGPKVWAVPGGGIKRTEEPEAAVRREILEEVGCEIARLQCIGQIEENISGSNHLAYIFAGLIEDMPQADGREIIEARLFPAHSLPEPLGRITRERLAYWRRWMGGETTRQG